jgi:hypothetical protein
MEGAILNFMKLTNEWLDENKACFEGREWLKDQKSIETLTVLKLLEKTGHWNWFRWLAARLMTHAQKVEWAIFCADQVIEIYEKRHPKNTLPREAIEAAKNWLKDPSSANQKAAQTAASAAYAATAYAADAAAYARQKMRKTCAKEAYRILKNLI